MKTAIKIKDLEGWNGAAALYELSEPVEYNKPKDNDDPPAKKTKFVVVSAINAMFSGPETFIFPANEKGEVADWGELGGSYRGGFAHATALQGAGYLLAELSMP